MPEHTESQERQSYRLREEDLPDRRGDLSEGIADAANDNVLEESRALHKRRLL